mmetsp:Transcript_10147/g.24330  ORF Transcript_10147/g.24330 Transcript_10147/m.24330 type:complete len:264 (+) Transcript_10147:127-918(+)
MVALRKTGSLCQAVVLLAAVVVRQREQQFTVVDAFATHGRYSNADRIRTTRLFAALPDGYREFGENAIMEAARVCGMNFDDESGNRLDIQWKAGTIIVTVHGEVALRAPSSEGEETEKEDSEEDMPFENGLEEEIDADEGEEDGEEIDEEFSLTLLARTINKILDDDGVGLSIAEAHSIEVTTPGVSDLLVPGTPQFEAFMGFEVIVEQMDRKKNKVKKIEGRLHDYNDEITVINIKGRMKKIKNESVISVRLPKAKKEKGGR